MKIRLDVPVMPIDSSSLRYALSEDVEICERSLVEEDTPSARRSYVRCVVAHVEGVISVMRASMLTDYRMDLVELSRGQLALLLEEQYEPTSSGDVKVRRKSLAIRDDIRFVADLFADCYGKAERIEWSKSGWQELQATIEVRHRITHPKVTTEFDVSENEIRLVKRSYMWFLHATLPLFEGSKLHLIEEQARASAPLSGLNSRDDG